MATRSQSHEFSNLSSPGEGSLARVRASKAKGRSFLAALTLSEALDDEDENSPSSTKIVRKRKHTHSGTDSSSSSSSSSPPPPPPSTSSSIISHSSLKGSSSSAPIELETESSSSALRMDSSHISSKRTKVSSSGERQKSPYHLLYTQTEMAGDRLYLVCPFHTFVAHRTGPLHKALFLARDGDKRRMHTKLWHPTAFAAIEKAISLGSMCFCYLEITFYIFLTSARRRGRDCCFNIAAGG
jgi:hypothetical protein